MDFVTDGLATGRMVRILTVVDAYTRECLALEADFSLGSGRVTRVLERAIAERGRPENLRSDNVLTQEGKAGEKRRSLSIPYGMCLTTTVPPSGFHEQGRAFDHSDTRSAEGRSLHCTQNEISTKWKAGSLSTRSLRPRRPR